MTSKPDANRARDASTANATILPTPRRNVCQCAEISYERMREILDETRGAPYEVLQEHYQVGGRCTSCEYEVKDMLKTWREERVFDTVGISKFRISFGRRASTWYRQFKLAILNRLAIRRFAVFVLRKKGLSSSVVLSNLTFPEDRLNVNGESVHFSATLRGEGGALLAQRIGLKLSANQSAEYSLEQLFPSVCGDVIGTVYIDFSSLRAVGSLRPYCVFNFAHSDPPRTGRWHYHDKYAAHDYNGHYHCNHPFPAGEDCWMAISNPLDRPYRSKIHFRASDGVIRSTELTIPPLGSQWQQVRELFKVSHPTDWFDGNALVWFESQQRLMVWWFWKTRASGLWIVQHH